VGTQSPTGPGGSRARLQFIDLLRGWAVIVMIQTHVLNATLRDELRGQTAYHLLSFIDGLVAPSFIFASGFAFAIALRRKLPDYLSFGPALGRLVGKLLFVLALGYALHLPVFSFRRLIDGVSPEAWTAFWAVDVLQCIAISLLLVLLILQIVRTERRLFAVLPWVAAGIVLLTPVIWSINPAWMLPLPVATYLNAGHGSQFPLFPWSAFLLSGVAAGGAFVAARGRTPVRDSDDQVRSAIRQFAVIGAGMIAASFLLKPVLSSVYPPHDYWRSSPSFVILRLGLVLLLLSLCYAYERRKGVGERSIVALIGRESLLVYAAHLMLIYGEFGGFSFLRWANRSFRYSDVFIATVVLFGFMVLLALWWDRVRRGDRTRMRLLQGLALAGFLIAFLVSPG
jgi:uncharacterized membrane protein